MDAGERPHVNPVRPAPGRRPDAAPRGRPTELFPTALRGTIIGWFALISAVASVTAQGAIAFLAQRSGGLSVVVGYLALLTIPSAVIFGMCIEETRGLSLEVAAREDA